MAKLFMLTCLFLVAITLTSSARILDELTPPIPLPVEAPDASDPIGSPASSTPLPSSQIPAIPTTSLPPVIPTEPMAPLTAPVPDVSDSGAPLAAATLPPVSTPVALPTGQSALSFYMHDILGGSSPSGRVVTGIVTNTNANNLPFSKPSNRVFPVNGGVPINTNTINGAVNSNNYPFLVGLNGAGGGSPANSNNNGGAFVSGGQLPQGLNLQQLMFGSVTVVDNEITEGRELGTGVLGRVQGFYIASSSDGSSHTLVLTALFHGGEEVEDTVSFFGVHRTATPISHLAIVGGTGKYGEAKGHATIETLPHEDQHTTDGVETITHFTLHIAP